MKEKYRHMTFIQSNIVKTLWRDNMLTRGKLCEDLKEAWTTMFDNLKKLLEKGIIEKESYSDGKRGRPLVLWSLTEEFVDNMETELENEYATETNINTKPIIK